MHTTPTAQNMTLRDRETPEQLRVLFLSLALVGVAVIFVISIVSALNWRTTPFMGVMVSHNMTVTNAVPNRGEVWNGLKAGLQPGDQIIRINDTPLKTAASNNPEGSVDYQELLSTLDVGDEITVTFIRYDANHATPGNMQCGPFEGGMAMCTVSFELGQMPNGDFLIYFGVPPVSATIVLSIAIALFRLRMWDAEAFTPTLITIFLASYMVTLFDNGATHTLTPIWLASGAMLAGALLTIILIFPTRLPALRSQPYLRFAPAIVSAFITGYVVFGFANEAPAALGETARIMNISVIMSLAIAATMLFFFHRPFAPNPKVRNQANVMFIGVSLSLAPAVLWLFGLGIQIIFDEAALPLSFEAAMPFFITPALSLAYAVLQYRQFDTDRIISQGITYSIMFLSLAMGYMLLVLGASLFTTDAIQANDPLIIVLTIFAVSILFVPVRVTLQRRIDEIYFRTRRDYQGKLESFGQKLASLAGVDVMINEFHTLLDETIQPTNTIIFLYNQQNNMYTAYGKDQPETDIAFGPESGVVKTLKNQDTTIYLQPGSPWPAELHIDRVRLGIIRVMVIAGMAGRESLNGFVAIGPPRSGANAYNFEELRFINSLVGQLAVAVERAQVISSLERSVRELEVISQVGQAVNFTIELDDLLELLSSQTLRLIDAPYFYIALVDNKTDQLYYAFFLEDDERDKSKENRKWNRGNDLYSDVIKSGQPMLLEDYAQTMQQHNYPIVFENSTIRAWMGVPLIAGVNTLGVLAAGTSDPSHTYTEEQLRVFSNIAALAATSIEKANLFAETNTRARQLEVLNDISRQLVASEGNVDLLLELITSSAVEILNAEAGSLLLTVSEENRDLVFRAAIGGTGHELLGTRLPAGHGLVGKVADTGKPEIVNDTSQDERWEGEVVQEGFHTSSILAVPLTAKNRIIGVLEIINKKDGSIFVEADADLLTTFAGQAAIALENARLLQLTDQQLSQRVKELESLEILDRELNQNLELDKVGEITVRWALQNSNAKAGLLGVVNDAETHLQIIAKQGYGEEDVPATAEDNLWPLDKGIVKRVMRTRGPDLQPDVSIDPDYVPSLQNALSQITVPMLSGDAVNAILILETDTEPKLNLLDLAWCQRLSDHASIAIANAQLYSELLRANETKSEFVAFAAHELKNPLTPIRGNASILKSSMAGTLPLEQIQEFATVIQNNADRMQTIIDDLNDIAKSDAGKLNINPKPISFHDVVEETLASFSQPIQEKNQTIENDIPEDLPLIMGDHTRLIQVVLNFVSNANKYSPAGGTIRIKANVEERYINRKDQFVGAVLKVSVSDNGIGMSEDDLKRIFREDYFRSENELARREKGTGLGMMITQRIIQGHNGDVWVTSELGEGSTFHFTIPLAPQDQQKQPAQKERPATEPASD